MRRLPGPAGSRLSEGNHTPEALFGLFRDWQRTQTQSSVRTLRSLRQQIDVWFCEQEPPAERHKCVRKILIDDVAKTCFEQWERSGACVPPAPPLRSAWLRSGSGATQLGRRAGSWLRETRRSMRALMSAPRNLVLFP